MERLVINKGFKEYQINDDENAVIRVSTTDFGLIDRLTTIDKKIKTIVNDLEKMTKSDDEEAIKAALREADEKTKQEIDNVFGAGISAAVFGDMNCLSFAGGQPIALNFIDAIAPKIKADLDKEQRASEKRIKKYTEAAKTFK